MRRGLLVAGALLLNGCATIFGPPDDPPPEALSANFSRSISPNMRDQRWPQVFESKEYVARLICSSDDWLTSKAVAKKGLVETYEFSCPGEEPKNFTVDVGYDPPPPPEGTRLIDSASFNHYREAFAAAEKKDYDGAMAALDEAHAIAPKETIYERDRIYLLYQTGKLSEALIGADELASRHPSAVLYKYRALAARDLGLRSEVLTSLDGMIRTTKEGHPLFAEAVCAKGLVLEGVGDPEAIKYIERGCALKYTSCCDALRMRQTPTPATPPAASAPAPDTQASATP